MDDQSFLAETKVLFRNVSTDQTLTFRILAQPISSGSKQETLVTLGMALIRVGSLALRTWVPM